MTDPTPDPASLRQTIADLTAQLADQRRSDQRLRQLEEAVEQSPSVVLVTDTRGCIEYANRKFSELTGYTREEVIGKNPKILKSGKTPDHEYRRLWEAISTGSEWSGEFLNRKKNGDIYWGAAKISAVRSATGKITHFVEVMEDITERKNLEQALVNVSEGERQQIGQELHDVLGQQITGISLLARSLAQQLERSNNPFSKQALEIEDLAKKALGESKRLARGLFPTELRKNGLYSALDHLSENLSQVFSVACSFDQEENLPTLGKTASLHLYRIAQEAASNAIRHGRPTRILIRIAAENDYLVLEVVDDGIGIPDKTPPGRGMGLLIMAHRADLIRGAFAIRRLEEGGTVVECRIPMAYATLDSNEDQTSGKEL